MYQFGAIFLLLSGTASLTYQVVWVRLLGLSMGSTSASISTVLAAFFLGMALGSYLAERITRNRINNLNSYIVLELLIGISGLLLLPVLMNLDGLMQLLPPALGMSLAFKFAATIILLIIPTVAMGATFPVMASLMIRRQEEVGQGVSHLYSLNTAGAVLGACLSGFVFIPTVGLNGAVYIAVFLNLFVAALAFVANRHIELPPIKSTSTTLELPEERNAGAAPLRYHAMVILFVTGFVSIATEVGWTKYLSIFAGTTIYGFAAILTVFLVGIASGSWVVRRYLDRFKDPLLWLSGGLIVLGTLLLLTRAGLTTVPAVGQAVAHLPASTAVRHGIKYLYIFVLLFPPTFVLGALLPLNLRLYCGDLSGVRARIGRAYAINTLASILGSVAAGFWLIPQFGTDVLLTMMAAILLLTPLFMYARVTAPRQRAALLSMIIVGASVNWWLPHLDYRSMIASVSYDINSIKQRDANFLYLKEGKAGVVAMVDYGTDEWVRLQSNGLNESLIDLQDEDHVLLVESLLALVPYLLHDDPKDGFVLGFGGGITTRSMTLTQMESIHVVELEPAVIEAGKAIRGGSIPFLQDSRLRLDINDARNTLLVENSRYDIIAAQPSHPWLAGAANVFTEEFFQIVHSRLNEGGIFSQWVNLFNMDVTTLRSIIKAFYNVFPEGMTFANLESGDFILFGSDRSLLFDYDRIEKRMSEAPIKRFLGKQGIYKPDDLFYYFALSRELALAAAGDIVPNSDRNILSEVRLSATEANKQGYEDPYEFLRQLYNLDVASYFKSEEASKRLDSLAARMFYNGNFQLAKNIADHLESIDPLMARVVRYEIYWQQYMVDELFDLFDTHDKWPDRTLDQHVRALLELKRFPEAQDLIKRIGDKDLARALKAQLLYETNRLSELRGIKPHTQREKIWVLLARSELEPLIAGAELEKLIDDDDWNVVALAALVRYYAVANDIVNMNKRMRQLVSVVDKMTSLYEKFIDDALEKQQVERAQIVLHALEQIQTPQETLEKLRRRIADAQKQGAVSKKLAALNKDK